MDAHESDSSPGEVRREGQATRVLARLREGDRGAATELLPLVYEELRALAASHMRRERVGHTLQPTLLVHDAFLQLIGTDRSAGEIEWQDRSHFFGLAANVIRQILVDHAREHNAQKRGGGYQRVTLGGAAIVPTEPEIDLLELDDLLQRLAELDARQARVVELRFFGGLSVRETALQLDVSERTVKGDWQVARAWLKRELENHGQP